MRTNLRRVSRILSGAAVVFGASLVFQNCAGYAPKDLPEDLVLGSTTCLGPTCPTNAESIQLSIGNSDPERIIPSDVAFNIGGYCDTAGYPRNRLVWRVVGATNIGPGVIENACDELGRFQFRVDLPAGFAFGAQHTLQMQLKGIDANGTEIDNPLGLNKKEIGVASNPP